MLLGNHLPFDGSGRPTNSSKAGTGTTDSQMRVQKVFLEKGLCIEGACDEGRIPGSGDDQRRSEYLAVLKRFQG